MSLLSTIKKIGDRLARPDILFYSLPWLIVLLVIGTVAQREIGLYHAERLFFSSWIVWLGFVPLPGGYLTLGIIFLNLSAKFIFKSEWSVKKAGTIVTHFGILLLFIGAIFTAATTEEGFLLIIEGEESATIQDYHRRSLFIHKDQELVKTIPFENLIIDEKIPVSGTSLHVTPRQICQHCDFFQTPEDQSEGRKGFAAKITLKEIPPLKENEANLSGMTFLLSGADADLNGTYVTTEAAPHILEIPYEDHTYSVQLKRNERALPFSSHLHDFVRQLHPGTATAKNYYSDIEVIDGTARWPLRIGMNEPLRYKGYTFFQSSFVDTPKGEATILAVVKNTGWLFPYIASAVIALGLLMHLVLRVRG